jgi:hypothetical protein
LPSPKYHGRWVEDLLLRTSAGKKPPRPGLPWGGGLLAKNRRGRASRGRGKNLPGSGVWAPLHFALLRFFPDVRKIHGLPQRDLQGEGNKILLKQIYLVGGEPYGSAPLRTVRVSLYSD